MTGPKHHLHSPDVEDRGYLVVLNPGGWEGPLCASDGPPEASFSVILVGCGAQIQALTFHL